MKIVPFIFNWPGHFEQAVRSEQALLRLFDHVWVINSDESRSRDAWVDLGAEAYFSAQFLKAVDMFDGDILFHVQADASYEQWDGVFHRAIDAFERANWGVFAPHVEWTAWKPQSADIQDVFEDDPDFRLVACTDCTCWMIHADVIDEFRKHRDHFRNSIYGWGIDVSVSALSYMLGRPVIRDYQHVILHPEGRGYDTTTARAEYDNFLATADSRLRKAVLDVNGRRRELTHYLTR